MKNVNLKQMKRISVIWGLIMFLALAGVTVLGFVYKNETKKYKEFESLLVEQSHEYVLNNNLEKISLNELKEKEVISSVTVNEKECEGYVSMKEGDIKAFIQCGDYKTRGYKE